VDELLVRMYDEPDRPHDPHLPEWIRDVLVMCDFESRVQMLGLLGWWENAAKEELDLACRSLRRDWDA
jgi:hypothetical protein